MIIMPVEEGGEVYRHKRKKQTELVGSRMTAMRRQRGKYTGRREIGQREYT